MVQSVFVPGGTLAVLPVFWLYVAEVCSVSPTCNEQGVWVFVLL